MAQELNNEIKYSLYYKLYEEAPQNFTDSNIIEADTLLKNDIIFREVSNYSQYYDKIFDNLSIECDTKYKSILLVIKNTDTGEVVKWVLEDLYPHQYKYCLIFIEGTSKCLLGVRTFYHKEYATFSHSIAKIEFDNEPSSIQHVDIVLTDADPSVTNDSGIINTTGNVILHKENISVNKYGEFIVSDNDSTLQPIPIPEDSFSNDSRYNLYVYHKEQNEVYLKEGYTPILNSVEDNPIWGKICYQDSDLELYTDVDILSRGQISADKVKWYFDLSNSTHGIGASGGIQYPVPDEEVTDFNFIEATSKDSPEESYTAMYTGDGNYIALPNKYYKEDYDDKGFASNCWTNDIFGDIDFSKLSYNEDGSVKVDTNGNYLDKWGENLTEGDNTFRTLFFKFYIGHPNEGYQTYPEYTLLKAVNGSTFITIKVTSSSKLIIHDSQSNHDYEFNISVSGNTISPKTWYNFFMVVQHGVIKAINISDIDTCPNGVLVMNKGINTIPGTEDYVDGNTDSRRKSTGKTSTLTITYRYEIGLTKPEVYVMPVATVYKYAIENELIGSPNTEFSSSKAIITKPEIDQTNSISMTFTHGGYAIIPGIRFVAAKNGFTEDFGIIITSIKLDDYEILPQLGQDILDNRIVKDAPIGNGRFYYDSNGSNISVNFDKTGNVISNPIGGTWINTNIDCSFLNDSWENLNPNTFNQITDNKIYLGTNEVSDNPVVIGKVGLHIAYLSENISIENPYEFIPEEIVNNLGRGYTYSPKVKFTYDDGTIKEFSKESFKELKSNKIWVRLPNNLPLGDCTVDIISGDESLYTTNYIVKTVKPDDATIDFNIDFTSDFDTAINRFKDIFYIRQEKRAGDLSGGENGHLVYFNRGEKCAVWENHGDFYNGQICCNEKDSGNNRWYGGVAPQIQFPLNTDGSVKWYSNNNVPNPLLPRTQRVGSLVQSKNYYGYGEFEIEMKIPKNFKGEAICWWMFHYQELYWPLDKDRFNFYAGGATAENGDDEPCHEYTVGDKKGKWNYRHSFKMDSGLPYIIVNNEIDMELGSEINQINTTKNPNEESSIIFYVPLLDPRTVIGCTTEGPNYGLWMLDYEASKNAIQAKLNQIAQVSGYIDRENGEYLGIPASELTWVHVSTTINDRICYDASTRAIRWNNWWTEPDIGGTLNKTRYSNAIRAAKGFDNLEDGTSGWDMCNTVGSTTPRTPLGDINLEAPNINDRYIPHEMDDNKWHTYKFVWHRDYTECYIDNKLIRRNATCSPFIPMPFLIGGWFPSDNSWGDYANAGYYGTWAGVTAPWDIRHFYIRKIKYRHYTEEESPRDQMLYHGETYPYSGLREFDTLRDKVTVTLNITKDASVTKKPTFEILSHQEDVNINNDRSKLTSYKNIKADILVKCYKHTDYRGTILFDKDKTENIQLSIDPNPTYHSIKFTGLPSNYIISVTEGEDYNIVGDTITSVEGNTLRLQITAQGYETYTYSAVFDSDKTVEVTMRKAEYKLIFVTTNVDTITINTVVHNVSDGINTIYVTQRSGTALFKKDTYFNKNINYVYVDDDDAANTYNVQLDPWGKFLINVNVPDYTVNIPGSIYRDGTYYFDILGRYPYTISKEGYKTVSGEINATAFTDYDIDVTLLKYVNLILQVNIEGFSVTVEEDRDVTIDGNTATVACLSGDVIHYTISKEGYAPVTDTATMYTLDRTVIVRLYTQGGKNLRLNGVSYYGSVIIPVNGYSENGIVESVKDPVGNIMTLTVKPNVDLGQAILFPLDYPPYVWTLPSVTDEYDSITAIDLPIYRDPDDYTKLHAIKRRTEDNVNVPIKLELNWGDGYYEIPPEYENLPRYPNSSWQYRCSADGYTTQEGNWTIQNPSGGSSTEVATTTEIILYPSNEVTIVADLFPATAIMDVMNPDDSTHTQISNGESVTLVKNKTYYITVSANGYLSFDENKAFSSSGTYSVNLEQEVVDYNNYGNDYERVYSKIEQIKAANPDDEYVLWGFLTDSHDNGASAVSPHINTSEERTYTNTDIVQLATDNGLSIVLHGGDSCGYGANNSTGYTGEGTTPIALPNKNTETALNETTVQNIEQSFHLASDAFKESTIPFMYTAGNNDSQGGGVAFNVYIPPKRLYDICVAPFASKLTYTDTDNYSTNSYYDDVTNKVRFVSVDMFFDTNHNKWEGSNLNLKKSFIYNTVNSAPSDYKIVILSHDVIGPNYYGSSANNQLKTITDSNKLYCSYDKYEELYDYIKTSSNFNNVIMFINGHHHINNQSFSTDNKLFICSEAAALDDKNVFTVNINSNWDSSQVVEHNYNTDSASKTAFDVFVLNKTKMILDVIRLGHGGDRLFNLNNNTFYYGALQANLTSSTVTNFSNYCIIISTNLKLWGLEDQQKDYKQTIILNSTSSGVISTENAFGEANAVGSLTKLGIPVNYRYTVQLVQKLGSKYQGIRVLGDYTWNENNNYTVDLGEVTV